MRCISCEVAFQTRYHLPYLYTLHLKKKVRGRCALPYKIHMHQNVGSRLCLIESYEFNFS
jgi:hypothetical protein